MPVVTDKQRLMKGDSRLLWYQLTALAPLDLPYRPGT